MSKTLATSIHFAAFGIAMLGAGSLWGQTPSFDVASIKPSEPITPAMIASGKLHAGMRIDGARVDIGNFRLMQLIMKAWDVKMYQVQGPPWLLTGQAFDIVANLPAGATKEQVPAMLQKLLADRFKLQVHTDNEPHSVYALVVGEGGPKLKESAAPAGDATPPAGVTGSSTATVNIGKNGGGTVTDGAGHKQTMTPSPDGKTLHIEISGATMGELADGLSPLTDQPIVDATGLKGRYDVTLDISMADLMNAARSMGANVPPQSAGDPSKPADAASDPGGSVFTAVKTLGLKLERRKEPLLRIVVDHCEKMPTDN
ncbi:MAG TPA: TIGR03435 family protein [Bryobacteraceae bacterium]|nr:TIGR03435 family protein [Bryobacteraceae bacterium]